MAALRSGKTNGTGRWTLLLLTLGAACGVAGCATSGGEMLPRIGQKTQADTSAEAKALFANPSREYSSAPLWVWSDQLTDEEVIGSLRDLAAQNVKQVFVHPRPGLVTTYLTPEWFHFWKLALAEAERLDMNVWIYDENSYPSGFAGGFVPDAMPEARGRGLQIKEEKKAPKWSEATLAVFKLDGDKYEDISAKVKAGDRIDGAKFLTCTVIRSGDAPWTAGKCYVDLLYPGVTEKFLDITLGAYLREVGDQFGKRVPGSFTDEPEIRPAGGLPWTDGLPQLFQQRWSYSLMENLPTLVREVGDWKRVRHDYYQLLLEQFIERWAKPYHDWCAKHNLEFTGHYWDHDWPNATGGPDNMAMYAWHQRPAIDVLFNQYSEDVHGQFGNLRMPKELSSAANQLGRKRTLCEAYGAGGWDLRFEDMKRIGDWCYVFGVNTLDQHIADISIRGARKHDHPQSFSYHEPWWSDYGTVGKYFERLTAAMCQGQEINPILVIEPTTSAWMYNRDPEGRDELGQIGSSFQKLIVNMSKAQVEYDIGSEDTIEHHGSVDGKAFVIGQRKYTCVVLSPMTETLNAKTMDLLEAYAKAGGLVLACDKPPSLVDGRPSDRGAKLAKEPAWKATDAQAVIPLLQAQADDFAVERADGDKGILFHHRRQLTDGDLLLLVNTSLESPTHGTITSVKARGAEAWDLQTGKTKPYAHQLSGSRMEAQFSLAPGGSLLLFLSSAPAKTVPSNGVVGRGTTLKPTGELIVRRTEPNVLSLDYADITAGGETRKDVYIIPARDFAYQKHGFNRDPWDRAVQFKDELIKKTFPQGTGFEATYRFTIKESVPKSLFVVVERPDFYAITCNDKPVAAEKGSWWLDKSFGKIDVSQVAKVGENTITLKCSPMNILAELDIAYVLGDFSVEPAEKGFVIVPQRPLKIGKWNEQGAPLYGAGVAYRQSFEVSSGSGRVVVQLPGWLGSVARVRVNGKPAGMIWHQPWECDITKAVQPGRNEVEVTVVGTLKNTLGPHHNNPPLGIAGPGSWDGAPKNLPPGKEYSTVGYGLFEPFTVVAYPTLGK